MARHDNEEANKQVLTSTVDCNSVGMQFLNMGGGTQPFWAILIVDVRNGMIILK